MSRWIDADTLKEFIDDCGICAICPQKAPRCSYDCDFPDAVTEKWNVAINAQPTIDAVIVVHGEWIPCTKSGLALTELMRREGQKWYGYRCSNCNFIYKGNALTDCNFCPNCGADMRGKDDE